MKITKKQLSVFKKIIEKYKDTTYIPKLNNWKKQDNNMLWLKIVGQIMVVGGLKGVERFYERRDLIERINFDRLTSKKKDSDIQKEINSVLREAGVRFASEDLDKCKKTKSLLYNLKLIQSYKGGMIEMLKNLNKIKGDNPEIERVKFLVSNFMFIKNKSARDLLMTLGLNRNTIAIDVRVQNIFARIGIPLPGPGDLNNWNVYRAAEVEIIEKICLPLGVEPIVFDRILFQNYDDILEGLK